MTTAEQYWQTRAIERLVKSEKKGAIAAINTQRIYTQAEQNINQQIQSIFENYSKKGILNVSELKKALTPSGKAEFLKSIKENAKRLGININEVYDERYLSRLTRLEALKEQIRLEALSIAPQEEQLTTTTYKSILKDTYKSIQSDFDSQGITPAFATMDKKVVDRILNTKFAGKSFSQRIWKNLGDFSIELPEIMGGALVSGTSYQKTASLLRERFDVAKYEATRLVVTETNYFNNMAELQSYQDDGIEEYEFDAIMDGKTSKICRRHNGRIYKVKDALVGKNYPPLHPWCRSTTRPRLK